MNAKNILVAGAAAVLLLSGAIVVRADDSAGKGTTQCLGVNSCKGHGACATAKNDCKGQNACKGQGMVMTSSADDCKTQGGTVTTPPATKN
jgi:hypothetical protein